MMKEAVVRSASEIVEDRMHEEYEALSKGRALPDGTIREWGGKKYKKRGGKWFPAGKGEGKGKKKEKKAPAAGKKEGRYTAEEFDKVAGGDIEEAQSLAADAIMNDAILFDKFYEDTEAVADYTEDLTFGQAKTIATTGNFPKGKK